MEEEYRTLEEKLKALTKGLNKRVSPTQTIGLFHRPNKGEASTEPNLRETRKMKLLAKGQSWGCFKG